MDRMTTRSDWLPEWMEAMPSNAQHGIVVFGLAISLLTGWLLLPLGGALAIFGLWRLKLIARFRAASASLAQVEEGRTMTIAGTVVALDGAALIAPLSGRRAVWVRSMVEGESASPSKNRGYVRAVDETAGVPFLVDDGSGGVVRVIPDRGRLVLDPENVGSLSSSPPSDLRERLDAFLLSRRQRLGGRSFWEELVQPGDVVQLVGVCRRPPRDADAGDRSAVAPLITMSTEQGFWGADKLLLTKKGVSRLGSMATGARASLGLGITALLIGVILLRRLT